MPWECKSCHGSISLDPDPRGCDDEPICWHCLYQHREALMGFVEQFAGRRCEFGASKACQPSEHGYSCLGCQARAILAEVKGEQ